MTIVQNRPGSPGGPHADRAVFITLLTPGGIGYTETGDIVGDYTGRTDETGLWSLDLVPTNQITPANSSYQVTEESVASVFTVPDSGGPYNLAQLLVTDPPTPAAPGITGVQVAVGDVVEGVRPEINLIAGAGMQISGADNPTSGRVDVTLKSTGGASPATTVVDEQAYGQDPAVGTLGSFAREDHSHGTPPLTTAAATASAPGDTATVGTATAPAHADHVHGREAYGPVTALTAFDTADNNGTAATSSRSDHVHGAPALPAASTTAAGIVALNGDDTASQPLGTQAAGASGKAADAAHVHPPTGLLSRQVSIACHGLPSSSVAKVGTWTPSYLTNSATGNFVGWVNQSDGIQGDSISFDFACGAGTYSLELYHLPFTNRGVYTVAVDGVTVGTVDGYRTSLAPQRDVLAGIVLTAGQHIVTLTMATKNASASSYIGMVSEIFLTRTA
ncbi:MAG: hypothetical protein ACRDVE_20625 [Actinocrinis sp.]